LGFRVKSGWTVAVLVEGTAATPRVLERHVVTLSDPDVPEARQPYHASTGVARETNSPELRRLIAGVESYARGSLAAFFDRVASLDCRPCGGGIAAGSDIDPAKIGNPHVRAHASEGRLFRGVVESALRERGLPCRIFVERDLPATGTTILGHPDTTLRRLLTELGRPLAGSWRRDDKMATLAAWLVLASPRNPSTRH
jgi:hypothetical protein